MHALAACSERVYDFHVTGLAEVGADDAAVQADDTAIVADLVAGETLDWLPFFVDAASYHGIDDVAFEVEHTGDEADLLDVAGLTWHRAHVVGECFDHGDVLVVQVTVHHSAHLLEGFAVVHGRHTDSFLVHKDTYVW